MTLCPSCAMREQNDISGFCSICEAVESVDEYRDNRIEEPLKIRRGRWKAWVSGTAWFPEDQDDEEEFG